MRDKQRNVTGTSSLNSRRCTVAFEMKQLAHADAEEEAERREDERREADFDHVAQLARRAYVLKLQRRPAKVPQLMAAE